MTPLEIGGVIRVLGVVKGCHRNGYRSAIAPNRAEYVETDYGYVVAVPAIPARVLEIVSSLKGESLERIGFWLLFTGTGCMAMIPSHPERGTGSL
jgi:hypothetical protein